GRATCISPVASCKREPPRSSTSCSKSQLMERTPASRDTRSSVAPAQAAGDSTSIIHRHQFFIAAPACMIRRRSIRPAGDNYFALAVVACRTDHAGHFHRFHQTGGTVVADLQLALYGGNGGAAAFNHVGHRLVVKRVLFGVVVTATVHATKGTA